MCPTYILVLLLALGFAATSLANQRSHVPIGKPPQKPTEVASLQEQENSLVNSYPIRPGRSPKGPSHGGHKHLTKELSLQEQENSQVNNYKPPHNNLPPKGGNSHVDGYPPRKPPHGPPRKPTNEEFSLQEQENSQVINNYPPKPPHKKLPPKKHHSQVDNTVRKPPHGRPHKPTTEELSLQEQEIPKSKADPGHPHVVAEKEEEKVVEVKSRPPKPPHKPPTSN